MTTTPRTLEELAAAVDAKLALAKAAQDAFVAANDSAQTAARARAAAVNAYEHAWAEHQAALAGLPLLWAERRVRHWDDPANDYVPVLVRSVSRVSMHAVWLQVHFPDLRTEVEFAQRRTGVWRHYINPGRMTVPWLDLSAKDVAAAKAKLAVQP